MRTIILGLFIIFVFPVQVFGQEISNNNSSQDLMNFLIPNLILQITPNDQFKKKYMGYLLFITISEDKKISSGKIENQDGFLLSEIDKELVEKANSKFKDLIIDFDSNCLYIYPVLVVTAYTYYEIEDNFEEGVMSAFPAAKFTDFECIITEKVTIVKRTINT